MVELEPDFRDIVYEGIVERIRTMPSPLREVFVLRHYQGRTESQIADLLGIKTSQVIYLLRQAERMLLSGVHLIRPPLDHSTDFD
ncbi:MAG: sigma-70 family RNA polymerase sigma factor [Acidobacteria bacterium]|nr:MAG: sigma-70 family RNA polymerase sigma factor [Acidobacteriota bacterium]